MQGRLLLLVQTTNDSSIVSKLSSSNAGYFEDSFLKVFVGKVQKRSAIINRGYYIRFKAIEAAFESWFSMLSSSNIHKSQIISLGAGFDSSYFRLKHLNKLHSGSKYIEIDYYQVIKRKADCIQNCVLQTPNFDCTLNFVADNNIVASSDDYYMIGIDLKHTPELENCLKILEVDFLIPTLFLSECAITYMDVESSDHLIKWAQNNFPNSAFITYEQVHPYDGFGIVMENHFTSLGCSLKSLLSYPTIETQCERYQKIGWSKCSGKFMFDFFNEFSDEEKQRIQALELFDEYEMWHEKCHHYILLWACQGHISLPEIFLSNISICEGMQNSKGKWKFEPMDAIFQRFGHQIILHPPHLLLLSGGFGLSEKHHQRLGGLTLFDNSRKNSQLIFLEDPQNLLSKRMFHSVTQLSNGTIVVLGGRSAPKNVFKKMIVLIPSKQINSAPTQQDSKIIDDMSFYSVQKNDIPHPTWRHSASLVNVKGVENIVVFGGCSLNEVATSECYILCTHTWNWTRVEIQNDTPSPRHSHSAVTCSKEQVFVTCGLSTNETILNSIHMFNSNTKTWSTLHISGLLPRYSHTSHYYKGKVFLVGGITSYSGISAGVGIIDLSTLNAMEISLPDQNPEYPILLSNHCSYIHNEEIRIIGGGGNCFSFGTHFNKRSELWSGNSKPSYILDIWSTICGRNLPRIH